MNFKDFIFKDRSNKNLASPSKFSAMQYVGKPVGFDCGINNHTCTNSSIAKPTFIASYKCNAVITVVYYNPHAYKNEFKNIS